MFKQRQFSFGHLTAGEHEYTVSTRDLAAKVRELIAELHESDGEHYQVYFRNDAGESLTIGQSGLMIYSPSKGGPETRYLPKSRDEVWDIVLFFLDGDFDCLVDSFTESVTMPADHVALFAENVTGATDHPLHKACLEGKHVQVSLMLKAGYDVNGLDNDRCTPLIYAAFAGKLRVCRLLVSKGADIHVRDNYGNSLLTIADDHPKVVAYFRSLGLTE